ncbi:MAG: hypothetical protein J6Y03_05085 [Alphaproteobacteria bacterium]|nr:hypothetical protein [Alphaproteobacteria bacterium]
MNLFLFLILLLQILSMLFIVVISAIGIYFFFNSQFLSNPPPVPSSGKIKTKIIDDVASVLAKRKKQVVMDLGSGWGTLLLPLARKFPNHRFIGIEYGFIPCLVSKFRARKMKNITFYRQNFFNSNISKADIIFLFLWTRMMPKISKKCQSEAKEGTLLYVNRFPIPDMKAKREVSLGCKYDTYYIYEVQKRHLNKKTLSAKK